MPPTHFYQQFASTTRLWDGTDSEKNFRENCAIEENYKKLNDLGWLVGYQKNYLSHDQNSELNRRKNLQAMQHICNKYNIPFYYDLMEDFTDAKMARDLLHCGTDTQKRLANKFFNIIKGNNK